MYLFGEKDLLSFNNLVALPCGAINPMLSIVEGTRQKRVTLTFLLVLCKSVSKGILGRSFLERLDAVASTFHMKITYHDEEGISITVGANLQEARRINIITRKNILASNSRSSDEFDLDAREEELRPIPDDEFESV